MSTAVKVWLIVAACLVLFGLIVLGVSITFILGDITNVSTFGYEDNYYEITEDYKNISITTDTTDVTFVLSENEKTAISCYEQKNITHSVTVKDNALVIESVDTRKWYEHIGLFFDTPKVTVYLPQSEYGTLCVRSSTGDLSLPECFNFESIDISMSTGDVSSSSSASGNITIKTSTGDINIENISADSLDISVSTGDITASSISCEGDIKINVDTGDTTLSNITCRSVVSDGDTGDIHLNSVIAAKSFSIERSTGEVSFDACDAAEIFVETDTGNVKGTLLSEKVFITNTDTGDVDVPRSTSGGICEITTDTGNIIISIN